MEMDSSGPSMQPGTSSSKWNKNTALQRKDRNGKTDRMLCQLSVHVGVSKE